LKHTALDRLQVRLNVILFLSKFSHIFFISFACHPLEGVARDGPPPP